jgi:flap endonuclease-1
MGVNIKDLVKRTDVSIDQLTKKKFSVDGFNTLYQFLATIRQPDGTPLKDSNGRVTSHLNGLFNRSVHLMRHDLRLAFVFDGEVPKLKELERRRRRKLKEEAQAKFTQAKKSEDIEMMKKYASRTTRLTTEMVDQAKQLLDALGIPWVQAPSEGEAQAALMAKEGLVYAAVSQDYDTLLYEAPRLIQNLSVSAKKKVPGKLSYQAVSPSMITLKDVLKDLDITQDKLISLCMLIGTDYNPGGVRGLGPKKALALVKKHEHISDVFKEADFDNKCSVEWQQIFDLFKNMPVKKDVKLEWRDPDQDKVKELLIDDFGFSKNRVTSQLERLQAYTKARQQKSLGDF